LGPPAPGLHRPPSSGVRLNEALGASWSQIDRDNRVWRIPASNSKSKRVRSVPLNDTALEVLGQLDTEGTFDHVFINRETGKPYTTIMKVWTRLRNKAGMPRLRLHDLRHSYASFLVNSGRTLYEVQQILGHSDAKVTERYAHLSSKTLQEAAKPPASSSRAPVPKRRSRASRDGSPGVRPGLPAANLPEKQTLRAAGAFFRGRDYCPIPTPARSAMGHVSRALPYLPRRPCPATRGNFLEKINET
jgi:hypothetical protein